MDKKIKEMIEDVRKVYTGRYTNEIGVITPSEKGTAIAYELEGRRDIPASGKEIHRGGGQYEVVASGPDKIIWYKGGIAVYNGKKEIIVREPVCRPDYNNKESFLIAKGLSFSVRSFMEIGGIYRLKLLDGNGYGKEPISIDFNREYCIKGNGYNQKLVPR